MILLFTDFGRDGPYVGQMKAALYRAGIGASPIVDLMHDAPAFNPRTAAFLLAPLVARLPVGWVVLAVVDPGVGGERRGAIVRVDGRWLVGPDNGLFEPLVQRGGEVDWWDIHWPRAGVSATFHGRDVFAPVAAMLVRGDPPPGDKVDPASHGPYNWPADLAELIYLDHYGNAFTGLRAEEIASRSRLLIAGQALPWARTFSDVAVGAAFWYENSIGLVEVAVNCGDAAGQLGLTVGLEVSWVE